MKSNSFFAAILTLCVMAPTAASAQAANVGSVAGWDIMKGAAGCYMQAAYEGNILVRMGLTPAKGEGFLTILDPKLKTFTVGKAYKVEMDLDGQVWDGEAKGVVDGTQPGIQVTFDDPNFFVDMMKKHGLSVSNAGKDVIAISLEGTNRALNAVMDCQDGKKVR